MRFTPFPRLKTERLLLRALESGDFPLFYALRSDELVCAHSLRRRAEAQSEVQRLYEKLHIGIQLDEWAFWVICAQNAPQDLLGTVCLWNFCPKNETAELGFELLPRFQKQGVMTEILQTVVGYCFQELNLLRLEARTSLRNNPCIRLLTKIGFQLDAQATKNHPMEQGEEVGVYFLHARV